MKYINIKSITFFILIACFNFTVFVILTISKKDVYTPKDLELHVEISIVVGFTVAFLMPLINDYYSKKAIHKD